MDIEDGWRFASADFSVQAAGMSGDAVGSVTLVRSPDERNRWHSLPEEMKDDGDGPDLYVTRQGLTFEEALANANLAAAHALPINI